MIDAQLIFDGTLNATTGAATGVAITAVSTTQDSTNVIDLLTGRDLGAGSILGIHVDVTVAFTVGTSLQIDFEVSSAAAGTYYSILTSEVIPVAQLIVGAPIFRYGVPLNQVLNATAGIPNVPGRFLKLVYTTVGTFSTGKVFSYISPTHDRQEQYIYPKNYTATTVL